MKFEYMKYFNRPYTHYLYLTFCILFLFSCSSRGATIHVKNKSGSNLTNIVISGNGFTNSISKLKIGESTSIQVLPKGESSLIVQFMTDGKKYNLPQDTYFEGQYTVYVEIMEDLTVNVNVTI